MTAISVLCPQNRPGGIDVLLSGLARQTLPRDQFELILIDDLHAFRADIVRDKAAEYGVNVVHVPPHGVPKLPSGLYEPGHYQRALNTGLMHARGHSVFVICDYTMINDSTLEKHESFQRGMAADGSHACLGGQVDCVEITSHLHPDFPRLYGWLAMSHDPALQKDGTTAESYQPWLNPGTRLELCRQWRAAYERDLAAGILAPYMCSVFAEPVTPDTDISKFRVWQRDKSELPAGQIHHQLMNLKANSFRVDDLLLAGGWDEDLDGCHGHQDSELAGRLEWRCGMRYMLYHQAGVTLFEPHGIGIIRGYWKPEDHNLKAYSRKWDTGQWYGGSKLDLRKMREWILGG